MSVSSEKLHDVSDSEEVSGSLSTCNCLLIVRDPGGFVGHITLVMCTDTAQSGALLGAGTDDGAFLTLFFLLNPHLVVIGVFIGVEHAVH